MKTTEAFIILALVAAASGLEPLSFINELELQAHEDFLTLLKHVSFGPQKHSLLDPIQMTAYRPLKSFSFKNCADPSTEILVPYDVNLQPDPIRIPGNITVSGKLAIKSAFGSPLKVSVVIKKQVFGLWIEVPCTNNIGSCSYSDVCPFFNGNKCPSQLVKIGLQCHCPFPAGNFTLDPFDIRISRSLPVKVSGGVKVHIYASYQNSLVTCGDLQFDLA